MLSVCFVLHIQIKYSLCIMEVTSSWSIERKEDIPSVIYFNDTQSIRYAFQSIHIHCSDDTYLILNKEESEESCEVKSGRTVEI